MDRLYYFSRSADRPREVRAELDFPPGQGANESVVSSTARAILVGSVMGLYGIGEESSEL